MHPIFVQIKCELGRAYEVASALVDDAEVTRVSEVYSTSGQFDLLAKFYLSENEDIGRFVTETIQRRPGIKDTYTIIALKAF